MSETESFESVARSYDNCTWIGRDGVKRAIDRLKAAHEREIRDVSQREFARGMDAGTHSMDAEHRAVAMRLRGLRFDGGSHENLARIAYAIYPCATGWTCESAAGLRDKLIDLMGGVSDDTCACAGGGACDADCGRDSGEQEVTDERLADDCGADSGCGDGGGGLHMAGVTDELREYIAVTWDDSPYAKQIPMELRAIADRIDERAKHDRESDRLRIEKLMEQRDELRARLDMCYRHASVEDVVRGITLGTYSMTEGIEKLERIYGSD